MSQKMIEVLKKLTDESKIVKIDKEELGMNKKLLSTYTYNGIV